MSRARNHPFGSTTETVVYPLLLLLLLWTMYWGERIIPYAWYKLGVLPQHAEGLKGIFFAPLLHAPGDIMHLVNNSFPVAVLLGTLVYFYRTVAAQVFFLSWFFTGLLVWLLAPGNGSYHIGISGIIYALAAFLFVSGTIRKYRPLQGISLFVVFVYGSMIWGIFPMEERVSWESHLFGLLTGVGLAFFYRRKGPQAPKYQYELEKELGIEPPDLEGQWRENIRLALEAEEERQRKMQEQQQIIYIYRPKEEAKPLPPDDTHPPSSPVP